MVQRHPLAAYFALAYLIRAMAHSLPMSLAGVIVPLARLQPALDVDELALRQEPQISASRSHATQAWYSVRSAAPAPRY